MFMKYQPIYPVIYIYIYIYIRFVCETQQCLVVLKTYIINVTLIKDDSIVLYIFHQFDHLYSDLYFPHSLNEILILIARNEKVIRYNRCLRDLHGF